MKACNSYACSDMQKNSGRKKILASISHKEPDRIPVDLAGTDVTSILAPAYNKLRRTLKCDSNPMKLFMPDQFLPIVEEPVLRFARSDVITLDFPQKSWVSSKLLGDIDCLVPAEMIPEEIEDGSWVIRNNKGETVAFFRPGGSSFRSVSAPLKDVDYPSELKNHRKTVAALDVHSWTTEDFGLLADEAIRLRTNSDQALALYLGGHVLAGGQWLMGYEKFMMTLALDRPLAEALLDMIVETQLERFDKFAEAVGEIADVVYMSDDMGTQNAPQLSPKAYREIIKPRHAALCSAIRDKFSGALMLHTDGAVREFIPDFIDMGIQALNPVQVSAAGMDSAELKRNFGADIAFWGGGCEGQHILPYGSPGEVRDEVKRRIDDFAPGGGFIFSHIHNIQPETPPENIVAMYEAVERYG